MEPKKQPKKMSAMPSVTLNSTDKLYLSVQWYGECVYTLSYENPHVAKMELHAFENEDTAYIFYNAVNRMMRYQAQTQEHRDCMSFQGVQKQIKEFEENLQSAYAKQR